ncbi:NTP transferase domain-containing protein [Campylobacter sputorum]|uniref:phosphocholine cytidylyltransferase family protein n=1 Tax=Campylobacter sputorum TaxID=206 RepID=UPI000B770DE6|nr:phosphocholine cytidylyltransferase family protein [Campylobacter sputorum]ASM37459.1 phosphocholine cytidylyltransferase [Campylobacter sputorum bv. faecalis CCUG 20703]
MKILLMAAGVGSRISRYLQGQPKCCVYLENEPLIRYTFKLLDSLGIKDIGIVTGYAQDYILKALDGFKFTHFQNPFFDITNSIASVYFARDFIDENDDLILMNADVFIETNGLKTLLESSQSPLFLADSTRIKDADYKFLWDNEKLVKFGKELGENETSGEYVGIAKICAKDVAFFKENLTKFIHSQKHNFWWEDVFYRNIDKKPVFIKDIAGIFWAEVDYIEDYERIKEHVKGKFNG